MKSLNTHCIKLSLCQLRVSGSTIHVQSAISDLSLQLTGALFALDPLLDPAEDTAHSGVHPGVGGLRQELRQLYNTILMFKIVQNLTISF